MTTRFERVLHDDDVRGGDHRHAGAHSLRAGRSGARRRASTCSWRSRSHSRASSPTTSRDLASDRDRTLMCGHTFIYSPPVRAVKRLIETRTLGDIYFISSSRVNLGLHQRDVSVIWDLGPHDFSILLYWLSELPMSVRAVGRDSIVRGIADVAFVTMTFASGIIANVELSWLAPSKLRRTVLVGSEKMVIYDDGASEPVRVFDRGVVYRDPETFGEYHLSYRSGDILSPKIESYEPLSLELGEFIESIQKDERMEYHTAWRRASCASSRRRISRCATEGARRRWIINPSPNNCPRSAAWRSLRGSACRLASSVWAMSVCRLSSSSRRRARRSSPSTATSEGRGARGRRVLRRGHPLRAPARHVLGSIHATHALCAARAHRRGDHLRPDPADANREPELGPLLTSGDGAGAGAPARAAGRARVDDLPGHDPRASRSAARSRNPGCASATGSTWPSPRSGSTRADRLSRCATRRRSSAG